jgi:hypothetical protein
MNKDNINYLKEYIIDLSIWAGLFELLNLLWQRLEIWFDGGIQPSISDSVIGVILVTIIWLKIKEWIEIK